MTTAKGEKIEFCWWEWFIKSSLMINGVPSASFDHYLSVSFAPNSVSREFAEKTIRWADKSDDDFSQKAKDFFIANTETPYRAEILADGTLIICWRTVTKRRDIYDAKIEWLKNNAAPPVKNEPSGTIFYRHETYAELRRKFKAAWTNLDLELHRDWSAVFQHEGRDEFENDASFGEPRCANEFAFALTDETTVKKARQMLSETYGGATDILRDRRTVEDDGTLANCND